MKDKIDLKGLPLEKLESYLVEIGQKSFRAKQLFKWIYQKDQSDFTEMTDLGLPFREYLDQHATVSQISIEKVMKSTDRSRKYLFRLSDGNFIEAVLIPSSSRRTLCISSQVGCPMGCAYCATGKMGFIRNLTSAEIVDQLLKVTADYNPDKRITNIVFMGMGEPLLNYDNVIDAIKIFQSENAFGFGSRKINLSTVGVVDKMRQLAETELRVKLALSLCSTREEISSKFQPNAKDIKSRVNALKYYSHRATRWVTIEFVMMSGVNDNLKEADGLLKIVKGEQIKINLIPFNSVSDIKYKPPTKDKMDHFLAYLLENNILATIRHSRGEDISGACGQLIPNN